MQTKTQNQLMLLGIGAGMAFIGLSINQLFPVQYAIASLVSPTGAQVTIAGLRIKHWLVGAALTFISFALLYSGNSKPLMKQISLLVLGAGVFLILDEYEAVYKSLTTGVYP